MIDKVVGEFGRLDVLVNNAAVFFKTPFEEISEEDWDIHIDTNLKGTFFCSQYAGKYMLKQKQGKIINTGDWSGIRPYLDYIPYCNFLRRPGQQISTPGAPHTFNYLGPF